MIALLLILEEFLFRFLNCVRILAKRRNIMKYIFIVNAFAGRGKSLRVAQNIKKVCLENKIDYEIIYTNKPGEATTITKKYKDSKCVIFSVGGDGTLNEVLNGIVGSDNLLGVIPTGSGNDFYKTLEKIYDLKPCIDIGKINDRYFINLACFGVDAEVAKNTEIMKRKNVPASQIYNASIIYTFFAYKFKEVELIINDIIRKDKFTVVAVCNGQYYGGGYQMAPDASLTDNNFDIYYIDKIKKLEMPSLLMKVKNGVHEQLKIVHKVLSDRIIIQSANDIICNIDGETLINKKFEIQLIKEGVTLFNDKNLVDRILQK